MLYLFLTGRRAAYLNDIFTVLNLPPNSIYDLKYKISNNNIVDGEACGESEVVERYEIRD